MIELNEHRRKHIDEEAFALVDSLRVYAPKSFPKKESKEVTDEEKPILTLSNVKHVVEISGNSRRQLVDGKYIHLDEENGRRFQKIASTLLSDVNLAKMISRDFIIKRGWAWLVKVKMQAQTELTFSNYIINEMETSLETATFYFPVVFLGIEESFEICGVQIIKLNNQFFDEYREGWNKHKPDEQNLYDSMRKRYAGRTYATIKLPTIELTKAADLAFEKCSLAVDVLKICSPALVTPDFVIPFDVDRRSPYNGGEQIIQHEDRMRGLTMSLKHDVQPFQLNVAEFEIMKRQKLEVFSTFILSVWEKPAELQTLILKAIRRFANALSNVNHHQRIAELISIVESLLLRTDSDSVKETVVRYLSRLVAKDVPSRKSIKELIGRMQKVRSAWVHHAKETNYELDDLVGFQVLVHRLLITLIEKSKTHKEKGTIFDEIDEAIWQA